jgi:hypothetical protein
MHQLKLPSYQCKIKETDGKTYIFDAIRKKYFVLTPEEWVRQHFVNLLLSHYGYSKSLIRLEGSLSYNKLQKRTDIVVFDNEGKPFLLVECKAADVTINQAVISQASRYNLIMRCPFLVVSNGINTFCFKVDFETGKYEQLKDLPKINGL